MKKRIIILSSVVLVVIGLWSAAWVTLAGLVKQTIAAQATADGVTEPQLICAQLTVEGFPFRFDAECAGATIVTGDIMLELPAIRASVLVYAPTHVIASAHAPLQLTDSFTGTRNTLAWTDLSSSIRLNDWRIARASVVGSDLVWTDALFGDALIASAPSAELHLMDIPEQHDSGQHTAALAGYLRAKEIAWPGFTLTDAATELQLELTGLPDDVRNWADPQLLPRIQQAGGNLKIVSIYASDDNAVLSAQGNLGLDPAGLLDGQIAITSTGVAERLGALLAEPWRTLMLGAPRDDGSYSNQLGFKGGAVFSGVVPVASVPPLF